MSGEQSRFENVGQTSAARFRLESLEGFMRQQHVSRAEDARADGQFLLH